MRTLPERFLELEPLAIDRRPHDHQRAAWDAMSRHFGAGAEAGILVIPTGGGKTFVAAHWLLEHHVREGGRVLWLTHRRSLLLQAMEEFERLRNVAHPKRMLGLVRISGVDSSWDRVDEHVDVVFSSLQTAVREHNYGFIEHFIRASERGVFVVVDEAHHAPAPSYLRLLRKLRESSVRLLGLTATPVRVDPDEERRLHNLFDAELIYQISRRELIERGFLAAPHFETVRTEIAFERDFTDADLDYLRRYGDLAPAVLERVATHSGRNDLIARHYLSDREKYGPTIVFAADALHAKTLTETFRRHGIEADYVDYTRKDAHQVMADYRERKRPPVLINVEMLTEGFDAPHTRTVFIARPTRSESLVMQMVGRALRGPVAGGNPEAFLVTFLDTWNQFSVVDAEYVIQGGAEAPLERKEPRPRTPPIAIPYELIIESYRLVQSVAKGHFVGFFECLPYGWYAWEQLYEDDLQRRCILIFENQRDGFEALLADLDRGVLPRKLDEDTARDLVRTYFGDLPDPLPRWQDLVELLAAKRDGADVLHYTFGRKEAFDPRKLAREFKERDLPPSAVERELRSRWENDEVLRHVYRQDFSAWAAEIIREQTALIQPPSPPPPPILADIVPKQPPRAWGPNELGYNLLRIKDAVTSNPRNFPQGPPRISELRWSRHVMKSMWGFCRHSDRQIRINCLLNSPDVPLFVLEFLLYHELLHAEMPHEGHGPAFRQREYAFAPSPEAAEDAHRRGIEPGTTRDAWRVLADQFLGTFDRHFLKLRPGSITH